MRDYLVATLAFGMTAANPEWTSLYHFIRLFRNTIFAGYFELTRGVSALTEALAERLPVAYEAPVRRLVIEKDRVVGVQMEGDGSIRKAGHVIVAVTPPAAAALLPEQFEEQRSYFDSVLYTPAAMPVFFLDRPLRRDVWCYLNDPAGERTFKFALDAHAKCPEMCPSGKAALTGWAVYPGTLALMQQSDAEVLAERLKDLSIEFTVKAGEGDKLFGSITSADISAQLAERGYTIDKRIIELEEPIKMIGIYTVPIRLHSEVKAELRVWVVKEE